MVDSKFRVRLIRALAKGTFVECRPLFEEIREFEKKGGKQTPLEAGLMERYHNKVDKKILRFLEKGDQ